jgi:hypothetical protein
MKVGLLHTEKYERIFGRSKGWAEYVVAYTWWKWLTEQW